MDVKENYSRQTQKIIAQISKAGGKAPRLLLHSCCAPCSSHCMELLREHFYVTVFFYNPNITEPEEYAKRLEEEKRLIAEYNRQVQEQDFSDMHSTSEAKRIEILEAPYDPRAWLEAVRGLEDCPEGGARCAVCFEMRLRAAAKAAASGKAEDITKAAASANAEEFTEAEVSPNKEAGPDAFDYFTTTLTISPLKNAAVLNGIGQRLADEYGIKWLPSDFKKKDGYKRSIELSRQFCLYRQNYCGCVFSKQKNFCT